MARGPRSPVRGALAAVAAVVIVAVACGGCSTHSKHAERGTTATSRLSTRRTSAIPGDGTRSSTTTRTEPGPNVLDTTTTAALRAHLVATIPGYTLRPAGSTGTGPSTLAAAARDAGGDAEATALRTDGFRAGYKLLFASGDRQLLVLAYRFASPIGASRYAARAYTARVHDGGTPSTATALSVPGARVVDRSDSDASAALVLFTRGATLVILSTIQPAGSNAIAALAPIATAQYAALAGY